MDRRSFLLAAGASAVTLNAAPTKYRIIDPHVHVWKRDPDYPFAKGEKVPAEDRTPEMLIALMSAHGVSNTVIIQVRNYLYDNRYLLSVLRDYPATFQGVARVNPESPDAPDHLSSVTAQGFQGVRISPAAGAAGDWIEGPLMPALWKRCEQLRVPMTVLAPISRMEAIGKLADRCPDLTIVIDHMADCPVDQPEELEKLIALKRHPKLFVKISHTWQVSKQPYPWLDAQDLVKRLHAAFGPERLMWATDWPVSLPHATYEQTLRVVRDDMPFLNADDKHWMLSKSIERVWKFS